MTDQWETADEYLSGNVRDKLETAKVYVESHPEYAVNVQALTQVQPKELDASEIEVRIGATWIDPKYIEDFMRETFETPQHLLDRNVVGVQYSDVTGQWNINHFKDSFCIADRKTQNEKTLHADLLLAGITQLVTVLVADKIHQYQYIRSLKPLID